MTKDIKLSGSSMERWSSCLGSAHLIAELGDRYKEAEDKTYASEGTEAHLYAEKVLTGVMNLSDIPKEYEEVKSYIEFINDFCVEGYQKYIEHQVAIDKTMGLSGTCDCILYNEKKKHLIIADLKYGEGIRKSAFKNSQLLFYACAAVEQLKLHDKLDNITLIIHQPRITNEPSEYSLTYAELKDFLNSEILPKAKKIFAIGNHCRYCPAKLGCDTFKGELKGVLKTPLTQVNLGKLLDLESVFTSFFKEVKNLARKQAEAGAKIEGYSLQQSIGNRQWSYDIDALVEVFNDKGVPVSKDDLLEYKLKTPAVVEKLLTSLVDKNTAKEVKNEILPLVTVRPSKGMALKKDGIGSDSFDDAFAEALEEL